MVHSPWGSEVLSSKRLKRESCSPLRKVYIECLQGNCDSGSTLACQAYGDATPLQRMPERHHYRGAAQQPTGAAALCPIPSPLRNAP